MAAPCILIEAAPVRAADGVAETVRLAGGGGQFPYFYGNQHWRAGVVQLPTFITAINFEGGDFGEGGVPQAAELQWAATTKSDLSGMAGYFWIDAPITVRIGDENASGTLPAVKLTGKVLSSTVDGGTLKIQLSDPVADMKKPLLTDRFGGTGGLDGPVEWAGKIKHRVWGRVWNKAGEPIDKANNIYSFADPGRPIQAFDAVRDKGAPAAALTVLDWQGSMAATLAALRSAAVTRGGGVACPSIACVKWWTQPAGELTADLRGEVGSGYVETTADIVARIVAAGPATPFAAGTIAAAVAARPAPVGWVANDDSTTVAAMIEELLGNSSLLWLLNAAGEIVLREWAWDSPATSAISYAVKRTATFRPVATRTLGFRRNERQMARGEIAAIVFADWPNIGDPDGTRPADNATVGATIGVDVKDGSGNVVPPPALLNSSLVLGPDGTLSVTIGGTTTVLGKVTLPDLGAASDSARRQLERDLESLSEAAIQLAGQQQIVNNVLRDAGLYTDPANGVAKLFAIENRANQITRLQASLNAALAEISLRATVNYVDEAILFATLGGSSADLTSLLARLTSAEATIDGLAAQVELKASALTLTALSGTVSEVQSTLDALGATVADKASQTVVDEQGARLTAAESTLSALDAATIVQSVSAARRAATDTDIAAENGILALLAAADAKNFAQTGIAQARTELNARLTGAFDAVASLSVTLGVQIGTVTAQIGAVQNAVIAGDSASASALAAYQVTVNGNLGAINTVISAQADTLGAMSATVSGLNTTVGGHTSTLTSYGASIDGLQSKTGVVIDTNGYFVGWELLGGAASGSITFRVDELRVEDPDGSSGFSIADGAINVRVGSVNIVEIGKLS